MRGQDRAEETHGAHANAEVQLAVLGWHTDLVPALRHTVQVLDDDILDVGSGFGMGTGKSQQGCEECGLHGDRGRRASPLSSGRLHSAARQRRDGGEAASGAAEGINR